MLTETLTFETRNYPHLLSSGKKALKQNVMNLRKSKIFLEFYLNLCFLTKPSMNIE